jgi:hypothetical protein
MQHVKVLRNEDLRRVIVHDGVRVRKGTGQSFAMSFSVQKPTSGRV